MQTSPKPQPRTLVSLIIYGGDLCRGKRDSSEEDLERVEAMSRLGKAVDRIMLDWCGFGGGMSG